MPNTRPDWNAYFMSQAYLAAAKSKDPSTRVGAVIVNSRNRVISTGYNGFPSGCDDEKILREGREAKLELTVHAELNAILGAAREGIPTNGCKIYVFFTPCIRCATAIKQAGIIEVIIDKKWQKIIPTDWLESTQKSMSFFEDTGVKITVWDGELAKIEKFCRGEVIK